MLNVQFSILNVQVKKKRFLPLSHVASPSTRETSAGPSPILGYRPPEQITR